MLKSVGDGIKNYRKAGISTCFCIFEFEAEKSADADQAAAGILSAGWGTMMPVFWISVCDGSSW
jgi:hypothetical protein